MKAAIDGHDVECRPAIVDFLVNDPPTTIRLDTGRPEAGDLVREFDNETTLYGKELTFEVDGDGDLLASEAWLEKIWGDALTFSPPFGTKWSVWRSSLLALASPLWVP